MSSIFNCAEPSPQPIWTAMRVHSFSRKTGISHTPNSKVCSRLPALYLLEEQALTYQELGVLTICRHK